MRKAAPLLAALAVLFSACAGARPSRTVKGSPPADAPAAARPAVTAADQAYANGASSLHQGGYEKALDSFAAAWKESPGHAGVAQDFAEALAGLKRSGDEAYAKGRAEEAGRRWAAALRFLGHPAAKGRPLPFQRAEVQAGLDRLSATLMEKGLSEYRAGHLDNAIATWRTILAYDPSHEEAAKSVRTATTQLENLKKLAPSAPPATK